MTVSYKYDLGRCQEFQGISRNFNLENCYMQIEMKPKTFPNIAMQCGRK